MSYPICAIQFNFRWLISSCGGANPVSYGMQSLSERSSLNLLVEDQGTCVGSTLYVARLAGTWRMKLALTSCIAVSRDLFQEV
ncbi:hypothetical protein N7455_007820 [Penicillium solitum]|uniref:uncharacterized protein n=1 Tax=Penicillium solitum TaxID=60172 RepID=UPI0032C42EBD|nr:hypothetical protein N7536_012223 [Penicillium majusculum]KAJ5856926.1 hypothetical protein N7455_007820 [Penicillium solitum]